MEINAIMVHHKADKTDYLLIEDFLNCLTCWRSSVEFNKVLDQHIDININNLRDKSKKESIKAPDKSAKKTKLKVKRSSKMNNSKEKEIETEEKPKKYFPNKSKQYLKLAKQKKEDEERALAMNIDKCKKELEFD